MMGSIADDMIDKNSQDTKEELQSFSITKDTPVEHVLRLGQECEQCGHCCSYGSGYFLPEDIARISKKLGMNEDDFKKEFLEETEAFNKRIHKPKLSKKPFGECVFLDKSKGCSIHDVKPLHCKVAKGCGEHGQELSLWFTLNYLVDPADPESVRQWAIYLKTHPTIPGGELRQLVKDEKLLNEMLNFDRLKK